MDINKLTRVYLKIRDTRSQLTQQFNEKDKELKDQQLRIEAELLRFLQANSVDSVKSENATVYRQEELTPSASDWDALYSWIKEHDAFDALEKRVKKTFIKEYAETNDGALPPGVSVYREYVVRVRRS
jgi:hypothetical protein